MNLTLDIETVGTNDPAVIAEIADGITPPKTMSKPETIAKWEAEDKPGLVADAVAKTSFDGGLGKIICIGFARGDANAVTLIEEDECNLLAHFFSEVEITPNEKNVLTAIAGHNVTFDLRFLYQRSVVHGFRPPPLLMKAMKAKPWDACIADTMLLWDNNPQRKISLDKLCRILGIPTSKGELNGSKIGQAYKDGQIDEIAAYCKSDVEVTRECLKRLTFN